VDTSNLVGSHRVVGSWAFTPAQTYAGRTGRASGPSVRTARASCRTRAMVSGTSRRSCARARCSLTISKFSVLVARPQARSGRWLEMVCIDTP